ncbi:MAG: N-acetylmuramoyl-L-alanine amidase [Moraxellaceae bacterium]|nr:N-acetylmuramoyl-L-alanine amidase [Moraxellaceae bacterium]
MKATLKSLIAVLGLSAVAINTWAASITAVRSWRAPDNTRIVLDLSEQVLYRQINSNNNKQLVLELDDTSAAVSTLTLPTRIGLVQNVLLESVGSKQRLIINLSDEVKPKVFMLAANEKLSPRLVIDLYDKVVMQPAATTVDEPVAANNEGRPVVVVVDAGHGGEDSGAIGATGNYEKHVTLSIAKKLVDILRKKEGFKAYLTRDGDYFIPLVERRKIARNRYKADIFISVHADAALSPLAKGASVFALSRKGANVATSRFAQAIADRENKSDLIGGVDNNNLGRDSQLTNILADMVVEGSMAHGINMGAEILKELDDLTKLHSKHVEQAGFAVLKEAGMISVLVETGFISSPDEEKKLIDPNYQQQMAQTIFEGVHRYVNKYPISQTYFAWNKEQRQRKNRKIALAEVGAPPPKVLQPEQKLLDKPASDIKATNEPKADSPVAAIAKPDKVALLASFTQGAVTQANSSTSNPQSKAPVTVSDKKPIEKPVSKPIVQATLPTSLDEFMAGSESSTTKKTPPPKAEFKPTITPKNNSHKVQKGDSLSSIAVKYGVSMQAIRDLNKLKDDNVKLDTTLKIPQS